MRQEKSKVPRHVAIIPDGNRRWARERGLSALQGHSKGLGSFEVVARHAAERGIEHLSLWGLSLDNLTKRSKEEVAWLLRIFRREFLKLAKNKEIHERQTRIRVLGWWRQEFPQEVVAAIEAAQQATRKYEKYNLNFFLAYNGTDEMLRAVQAILDEAHGGGIKVTPSLIKNNLFTRDLPPVDLVIRTAGEPHLSAGFMMWDVAYAQLYFSDKYWPDFDEREFDEALADFRKRARRLGA